MSWLRPVGYVALLVTLVLTLYLVRARFGRGTGAATSASAAASASADELGAPPPAAVRSSPAAAKRYIERQNCLAACASEGGVCLATADGDEDTRRCEAQKKKCAGECP
jgi:hypothetical protein